jgi:hypothetical protein
MASRQIYFDEGGMLRNVQTDMMMDTESVLNGNLGEAVLPYITEHIEEKMIGECKLERVTLPGKDDDPTCDIFTSPKLESFEHILVISTNKRDTKAGIWSRGVCISNGLNEGSMVNTIKAAQRTGHGVVVLNARNNYHVETTVMPVEPPKPLPVRGDGGSDGDDDDDVPDVMERAMRKSQVAAKANEPEPTQSVKTAIQGSETPEKHIMTVWDNVIEPTKGKVSFLAFDEGMYLVRHLLCTKRELASASSRVNAFFFVEPPDNRYSKPDAEVDAFMAARSAVIEQMKQEESPYALMGYLLHSVGIKGLSLQLPSPYGESTEENTTNIALGVHHTLDTIAHFLAWTTGGIETFIEKEPQPLARKGSFRKASTRKASMLKDKPFSPGEVGMFIQFEAKRKELKAAKGEYLQLCSGGFASTSKKQSGVKSIFSMFTGRGRSDTTGSEVARESDTLVAEDYDASAQGVTTDDFELLQVVGKGGFGKVFLVQKKSKLKKEKKIYAMKVLQKSQIFKDNQVEHTKAEKKIMSGIVHPYIVSLSYAFQTSKKLYMVMDFYAGGCLFFHLRRQVCRSPTHLPPVCLSTCPPFVLYTAHIVRLISSRHHTAAVLIRANSILRRRAYVRLAVSAPTGHYLP